MFRITRQRLRGDAAERMWQDPEYDERALALWCSTDIHARIRDYLRRRCGGEAGYQAVRTGRTYARKQRLTRENKDVILRPVKLQSSIVKQLAGRRIYNRVTHLIPGSRD